MELFQLLLVPDSRANVINLLNRGCDVNVRNESGDTPLHVAARVDHNSFDILLNQGAIVDARNNKDETPLMLALKRLPRKNINWIFVFSLLCRGSDFKAVDSNMNSVLHHAVQNPRCEKDFINWLLVNGAIPDALNRFAYPPITYCRDKSVGELLIQYSIFLNLHQKFNLNLPPRIETIDVVCDIGPCIHGLYYMEYHCLWNKAREQCLKDIVRMNSDLISPGYTMFEYLSQRYFGMSATLRFYNRWVKELYSFEEIPVSFLSRVFYNAYPTCMYILFTCINRNELLHQLSFIDVYVKRPTLLKDGRDTTVVLNLDCVEHLANYLSKRSLISLILAFHHH